MLDVMLSSDSHIIEPPDLWTSRLPKDLRERGPQVRRVAPTPGLRSEDQGEVDYWFVDGERSNSPFAQVKHPGLRFEVDKPWDIAMETTADSLRDDTGGAALAPADYVAHNQRDHVAGQVLFPTYALVLFALEDSALLAAIFRAYNDHAAEFCAHDPRRLKAAAAINVDDPALAVAEMKRVRALGLTAALIPVEPMPGKPYSSPEYEPIWSAAEDLDMPLCLHVGTNRFSAVRNIMQITQASRPNTDIHVRDSLAEMIFGGVFERHPRLRVGSVEHELGWLPFFLHRIDYYYTQKPMRLNWRRFADSTAMPSDFWRSNCFASFQEDPTLSLDQWRSVGIETLTWGSDYPHFESTYPRSLETVRELMAGLTEDEQQRVAYTNTKQIFGFEV